MLADARAGTVAREPRTRDCGGRDEWARVCGVGGGATTWRRRGLGGGGKGGGGDGGGGEGEGVGRGRRAATGRTSGERARTADSMAMQERCGARRLPGDPAVPDELSR